MERGQPETNDKKIPGTILGNAHNFWKKRRRNQERRLKENGHRSGKKTALIY